MRNEVAELQTGPAIMVSFEPEGEALLHEGKVKEALASYRGLIATHPNDAVHHLQVARVLLEAGMGEAARAEAREAVELDPNSALAERTLGDILKHDLVGRDSALVRTGPVRRKLTGIRTKLDPDDHTAQANLAILLEYRLGGPAVQRTGTSKAGGGGIREAGTGQTWRNCRSQIISPYALFYGGDAEGRSRPRRH